MAQIFDDILVRGVRAGQIPARTQDAREWFRNKARESRSNARYPANIIDSGDKTDDVRVGHMYHFLYDPKTKADLPYYDRFPLIFMVGPAKGGFYGINLHYLPHIMRAKLMDALYETATNKRYDQSTRLKISYEILKKAGRFKFFKPTFKHYLSGHVKSRFVEINSSDWDIALFLPTERFEKKDKQTVWSNA